MDSFTAVGIAEGFMECSSKEEMVKAWQTLVDKGMCWSLQGWFGRTAKTLLLEGVIEANTPRAQAIVDRVILDEGK